MTALTKKTERPNVLSERLERLRSVVFHLTSIDGDWTMRISEKPGVDLELLEGEEPDILADALLEAGYVLAGPQARKESEGRNDSLFDIQGFKVLVVGK